MNDYNWMAWNQRVLRNEAAVSIPGTALTEVLRFWLPFTELDGPYTTNTVLIQCGSFRYGTDSGGCCSCTSIDRRRYGNAGFVDESGDANDIGIWLPHTNTFLEFNLAFMQQAPGPEYQAGSVVGA